MIDQINEKLFKKLTWVIKKKHPVSDRSIVRKLAQLNSEKLKIKQSEEKLYTDFGFYSSFEHTKKHLRGLVAVLREPLVAPHDDAFAVVWPEQMQSALEEEWAQGLSLALQTDSQLDRNRSRDWQADDDDGVPVPSPVPVRSKPHRALWPRRRTVACENDDGENLRATNFVEKFCGEFIGNSLLGQPKIHALFNF